MNRIRRLAQFAAWLVVVLATHAAAAEQLSFTRPTIGAVMTAAPIREDAVLLDDESYRFVAGGQTLLVYGKEQRRWIRISQLTTEHARFGEAPRTLSVGWNDGYLINEDFAPVPLGFYPRAPERVVAMPVDGLYRVDFGTRHDRESALTSFWISTRDLEAAFRGERLPPAVPHGKRSAIDTRTDPSLCAAVGIKGAERHIWSIESGVRGTSIYGEDPTRSSPREADVSIGPVVLRAITLGVAADSRTGRHPTKGRQGIAGVIGADLFERFTVVVDYDEGAMEVLSPGTFSAAEADEPIAADWSSGVPVVRARISLHDGRTIDARLVVDTGTLEPLALRPSYAARHGVTTAEVGTLQLSRYTTGRLPLAIARTASDGIVEADGTIGSGSLRRFRVTFDRARSRIFLRAGALLRTPYDYDASGLRVVANGREFGVGDVLEGYAAPAGVRVFDDGLEPHFRVGDVIVQFDGQSPAGWTLDEMREAFRADGGSHAVVVRRHGTLLTIAYDAPAWQR